MEFLPIRTGMGLVGLSSFILFENIFLHSWKNDSSSTSLFAISICRYIPSMPIQLKHIPLVNMFDNMKDLKQVSIFILADFTSRTSTCIYSKLHLKSSFMLNFIMLTARLKFVS